MDEAVSRTTAATRPRWPRSVLVIALISAALAIWYRFGHGLTVDEPFMVNKAGLGWSALKEVFPVDNLPFAYVTLKLWITAFGESEFAVRMPSVLAFAAAVAMTGAAGARLGGAGIGIAAAGLVAASDQIGLEHAATARPYALLAAVSAAALLQSLPLVGLADGERGSRLPRAAVLAVTHLAGLFTHPTYVVVAMACAAASVVAERRLRSPALLAPIVSVGIYALVWGPTVRATIALQTTSWMHSPTLLDVQRGVMLLWGVGPGFMLAGALVAVMISNPRRTRDVLGDRRVTWVLTGAVGAWALAVGISMAKPIFEATRTPMMLLPFTSLALATVLGRLGGSRAAIAFAVICALAAGHRVAQRPRADPYPTRQSLAALLPQMDCGTTLIAPGLSSEPVAYYFRRLHAAGCLTITPYPGSVVNWTGRIRTPALAQQLEEEAERLAGTAASRAQGVWLLTLSRGEMREATVMMEAALRRHMSCETLDPLKGAFFDGVVRCVLHRH